MIEETAPLVIGDDEDRARPRRTPGEDRIDEGEERLAVADVGIGVVVARRATGIVEEARFDKGHLRQLAGQGIHQERPKRAKQREVARTPQG